MLARKRKAKAKNQASAERRFAEKMKNRATKQATWRVRHGVATAPSSIARDKPTRSLLVRTRAQRFGDYVAQPNEEEERTEMRAELFRGSQLVFPSF
jgi:hypothetical protein